MTSVDKLLRKISTSDKKVDMNPEIIKCLIDIDDRVKNLEETNTIPLNEPNKKEQQKKESMFKDFQLLG